MALQIQPCFLSGRAVGEWYVVVCDIVEKVNFLLLQQETGSNRVDWRITPAFVEESSVPVESLEEVQVRL